MDQPVGDGAVTGVMLTILLCVGLFPLAAIAQDVANGVKYDLTGLAYPNVARLAHVQGVVTLELIPTDTGEDIKIISGSPILVQGPRQNLAKWRTNQGVTVRYIFKLTDPDIAEVRVPKGDAFDRLFLRILHLATYRVESRCRQTSADLSSTVTKPRVVQQSPLMVVVEVSAPISCLIMQTSFVASR